MTEEGNYGFFVNAKPSWKQDGTYEVARAAEPPPSGVRHGCCCTVAPRLLWRHVRHLVNTQSHGEVCGGSGCGGLGGGIGRRSCGQNRFANDTDFLKKIKRILTT